MVSYLPIISATLNIKSPCTGRLIHPRSRFASGFSFSFKLINNVTATYLFPSSHLLIKQDLLELKFESVWLMQFLLYVASSGFVCIFFMAALIQQI